MRQCEREEGEGNLFVLTNEPDIAVLCYARRMFGKEGEGATF